MTLKPLHGKEDRRGQRRPPRGNHLEEGRRAGAVRMMCFVPSVMNGLETTAERTGSAVMVDVSRGIMSTVSPLRL